MAATVQKICVICGENVAGKPRTKDQSGRYYCNLCWTSAVADTAARDKPVEPSLSVCGDCGGRFEVDQMYDVGEQVLCKRCHATFANSSNEYWSSADEDLSVLAEVAGASSHFQSSEELLKCPDCGGQFARALMASSGLCRECAMARRTPRSIKKKPVMARTIAIGILALLICVTGTWIFRSTLKKSRLEALREQKLQADKMMERNEFAEASAAYATFIAKADQEAALASEVEEAKQSAVKAAQNGRRQELHEAAQRWLAKQKQDGEKDASTPPTPEAATAVDAKHAESERVKSLWRRLAAFNDLEQSTRRSRMASQDADEVVKLGKEEMAAKRRGAELLKELQQVDTTLRRSALDEVLADPKTSIPYAAFLRQFE